MKARILLLLAGLCLANQQALRGEGPEGPADRILFPAAVRMNFIGPFGGIVFAMHRGTFSAMENGILCCSFEKGDGLGPAAGVRAFLSLVSSLEFSPRILYENPRGEFTALLQRYPIRGSNNTIEFVDLENKLETDLHMITLDLLVDWMYDPLCIYVAAGPSLSMLIANHFLKSETIVSPPGVSYLDGGSSRVLLDDGFSMTNNFHLSLRGGVGARIALGGSLHINPEVLYSYPLTKVSKEGDWKVSTVQATLGILFSF
jgi:hypothetical protein